jgi:hypothetical protein
VICCVRNVGTEISYLIEKRFVSNNIFREIISGTNNYNLKCIQAYTFGQIFQCFFMLNFGYESGVLLSSQTPDKCMGSLVSRRK